jgi:hypothetical protein
MSIETHTEWALDRVREEQGAVDGKQTAYGRFVRAVQNISVETPTENRGSLQTTAGLVATMHSATSGESDRSKQVRELFADMVRPHSTADIEHSETLLETIAAELSDQLAVALSPQNATAGFTAGVKNGVLSEAAQRRRELRAMEYALDREEASLVEAKDAFDDVLQWIIEANETRLLTLDFEALRTYHDRLDKFHARCETVTRKRQSLLHATTSAEGQAGISQRELVECLYVAFPVRYPVLSTVVRVEQVCNRCQRALRDHLVRRV